MEKKSKIFVLDTNVILHDYRAIYSFEENDIVIPVTVLEELDKFKKGSDLLNFHAREFMRELDKLSGDNLLDGGIQLGKNKGLLFIETGKVFSREMEKSFAEKTPDHRILAVANYINQQSKDRLVVLITQDINLRMKAKALKIMAQDYKTGKVENIDNIYRPIEKIYNVSDELISEIYKNYDGVTTKDDVFDIKDFTNRFFILKGNKTNALAHFNQKTKKLKRIDKRSAYNITPRNAEQTFALDALLNPDLQLITMTGKAGTGKTLLALAAALQQRNEFKQIFLARPVIPLANRDLGYLPGDEKQKITPYMQPLFDNLSVIKHQFNQSSADYKRIEQMLKDEILLITPLAYIRGRSLSNVFFIVDEAQNLTPHEIKTIITRAGENTKMVFTGDIQQIDSPYLDIKSNGLSYLTDKMREQSLFAHINLVKGERSKLADIASDLL